MKTRSTTLSAIFALAGVLLSATHARAQHGHLNAGAIDTDGTPGINAGDALAFINGADFDGYTQNMLLATAGTFVGKFVATGPTMTSLPGTSLLDLSGTQSVPNSAAAVLGTDLRLSIDNVVGPAGSTFSIYAGDQSTILAMWNIDTNSLLAGDNNWSLTDLTVPLWGGGGVNGDLSPNHDPYGHIHGRRYVADTLGEFTVTFNLVDTSGNHLPAAPFSMNFAAVPEPSQLTFLGLGAALTLVRRRRPRTPAATR